MGDERVCRLCQGPMVGKKAKSEFCCDSHRMRWHRATTAVGRKLLESGIISDDDVRRADAAVNGSPRAIKGEGK